MLTPVRVRAPEPTLVRAVVLVPFLMEPAKVESVLRSPMRQVRVRPEVGPPEMEAVAAEPESSPIAMVVPDAPVVGG